MQRKFDLPHENDTQKMAEEIAKVCHKPLKIYLSGQLGAGKTTFTRYFLRALGILEAIKSPSYTLVERYQKDGLAILHVDCYRLGEPEELYFLGLEDEWDDALLILEWPSQADGYLPKPDLDLTLQLTDNGRSCTIEATTQNGMNVLEKMTQ